MTASNTEDEVQEPTGHQQPSDDPATVDTSQSTSNADATVDFESGGDAVSDASDASSTEVVEETRDEEMERLRAEVDDANKRMLQAQAEAENFRKRMRRDYEDQLKFASLPLVTDLLQVRDNLHRAIDAANTDGGETSAGLTEGVAMVAKQLDDTLAKFHITPIPAEGETFDPNIHEAISQMPHPEIESGQVAHVATIGYQMHDRVIRPAQVVVSTGTP
ncbi:MAG: nucleotide exchange factor GrpE [Planctomycetota bacterium]